MQELHQVCTGFREGFQPKKQDPNKPVSFWSEKEILNNEVVDAFVLILRTRGCSWGIQSGCSMCGYHTDSMLQPVSDDQILNQCNTALTHYQNQPVFKIFTSGSFLDTKEISSKTQQQILEKLREQQIKKISVESRPEYITKNTVTQIKKILPTTTFEIGIGLETAQDYIRDHTINKGFTFNSYTKATQLMHDNDVQIKTYVFVKPPFLTEQEAITDAIHTIQRIKKETDTISLNPANIQRFTLLEYLWRRKQYRAPWLWSILDIIKQTKKEFTGRIKCDVVGGGNIRGAHNCGVCDQTIVHALSDFSLHQDTKIFDSISCSCIEHWHDQLDSEAISFGSYPDFLEG